MPIDFPTSPTLNQTYTYNGRSWQWDGVAWISVTAAYGPTGPTGPTGATGPTGPAGTGVAIGGTQYQFLIKNSSTNYDTTWTGVIDGGTP